MKINIDYDKCKTISCLECLDLCPMNVFDIIENQLTFDESKCVGCLACQEVCSYDAIILVY